MAEIKMPQVLLTGAKGRIGTALRKCFANQWTIIPCSREPSSDGISFNDLLINTPDADVLVHCAWSCVPATAETADWPGVDLEMLAALIARLKEMKNPPLLVFFSTGAVYGPAREYPSRETDKPFPIGKYAAGKLAAEDLLVGSGLPVCILRIGTLYGLRSLPADAQGVVAHLIRAALSGNPFHQWGADSIKDYLHRDDFLAAFGEIIEQRLEGTWNVGSGAEVSLHEIREMVEKETGRKMTVELQPGASWDVKDNRLDISKLLNRISWRPEIAIETGIRMEVQRLNGIPENGR